jgi:hypothetical protein
MLKITSLAATKVQEFLQQNGRPEAGSGSVSSAAAARASSISSRSTTRPRPGTRYSSRTASGSSSTLEATLSGWTEIDYVDDIMGSGSVQQPELDRKLRLRRVLPGLK